MRAKTVSLALLLATAALTAQAQTAADAVPERAARAPTTVGSLDPRAAVRSAPAARMEQKAPTIGVGSPFSVFTYDALGATPRVELGRRRAAPDAPQPKSVAAR
ncbi:MAG: hypothetical protein OHK0044_27650 [Burkholderiaceae bacterium]